MPGSPTPNIGLTQNTVGGDTGTWGGGTGITGNNSILDSIIGGIVTVSLNNSNVVLNATQFQSAFIVFNSTLTGSVTITFPTSFIKGYAIRNACTGSSAFTVTLQTTAGGNVIVCPPNDTFDCISDGSNLAFRNFGRIGTYWDYAGSSVPAWVSGCTVPPYLNCDGTSFSAGTYPALAVILGGTTLPDSRGSARFALNQGTGRITSGNGGIDGNTKLARGGTDATTLGTGQIPQITTGVENSQHTHTLTLGSASFGSGAFAGAQLSGTATTNVESPNHTHTLGSSSPSVVPTVSPGYVGGLTLIRAG